MVGQLLFITISIALFGMIFFKMIKKNDTQYVLILSIQAIGIIFYCINMFFLAKTNIIFKIIAYFTAIIIPVLIIVLENKNINIVTLIKFAFVRFYMTTGNYKGAKKILISIIEKKSNNYMAHKYLAEIYEKEGGIRKAIDEYVVCIEINKQDYDSYYKIATLLNDLDKKDEAIEMLYSLLNKKPDYNEATITLGDLLIEKEKYKEAVSILTDGLKYNSVSFDLYYQLGIAYTMLNDFKNAKEYYEKAAEINSLIYNAKYSLAQIALLYKDLEKAEEYFQETIEEEDLSADSYFELAKIKLLRGEKEMAIKYANIAIDLDSKKISEKIKKEPLFITILSKLSIPFNLEEKEISKLTPLEIKVKEHLENTTDITTFMGYVDISKSESERQKEITNRIKEIGN